MNDFKKTTMKLKCSNCKNTIEFHEIKFPIDNDFGEKIIECKSCNETLSITCKNPNESYVVSGASEVDYLDYDIDMPSNLTKINEILIFDENFFDLNPSYDIGATQLYICTCKKCNLEEMAYSTFENKWDKKLCEQIAKYYTIDLKGYGCNPENAVVKINFNSNCGKEYSALFHTNYTEFLKFEQFRLGSIIDAVSLENTLSRSYTKKESMDLLKKLISRWSLFYEKILLISPYIESSFTKGEKIKDTLFGIIEQFPKHKEANIHTKTQTIKSFKKAITTSYDVEYKFLEDWDLSIKAIDESRKNNNSHAKMYIGVSRDVSEILLGSANMANGPSREVIHFFKLSTDELNERYLDSHLAHPLEFSKKMRNDVIFDENDQFTARELNKDELYSYL